MVISSTQHRRKGMYTMGIMGTWISLSYNPKHITSI